MYFKSRITALIGGLLVFSGVLTDPIPAFSDHAGCQDLHAAAFLDEPNELNTLLRHGVDQNCRDILRQTPLITATDGASLDIVKVLLDRGVTVNARNEIGETALSKARHNLALFNMKGSELYRDLYQEMIALLEKAGAIE